MSTRMSDKNDDRKLMIRSSVLLTIFIFQYWIIFFLIKGYIPNSEPMPLHWPLPWLWPPSISRLWDVILGITPAALIWIANKEYGIAFIFIFCVIGAAFIGLLLGLTFGIYVLIAVTIVVLLTWYYM